MKKSAQNVTEPDDVSADHMITEGGSIERGYLTGPGLHEFPVDFVVVDEHAYCEGCIDMGEATTVRREAERIRYRNAGIRTVEASGADGPDGADVQQGVGLPTDSGFLWTNGVVPYTIASDVPDHDRVADAIEHIEKNTAIRFVRRRRGNAGRHPNYVRIISNGNKGWSSSAVGMRGGEQILRLSDRHSWPILVHEFLHALGVYHEQSRSDRDEFVEIRWSNIPDGPPPPGESNWTGNFQKKPGTTDYYDYDYDSIMHYGSRNFARDSSKPTIVPLQPGVTIGQREGMSFGDRQTIAKMYERFFGRGYAGVWRPGTGRYGLWVNAEWPSFRDKWETWSGEGLRLHDIHVRRAGGKTLYSGVFLPGDERYALWANVSWTSFRDKWKTWSEQGLRLVDLHVHRSGGQNRYSGVFLAGSGGYGLWVNSTWSSFKAKWQEFNGQNLRLQDIHVHRVAGRNRYSGVFAAGTGGHGLWVNATWSSFTAKWKELSDGGLRLVDLNLHRVGDSVRYSGAFLPGNGGHYLWANVTFESLRAKWQELADKGLRLVDLEIAIPESGAAADMAEASLVEGEGDHLLLELEEFGGVFGEASEEPKVEAVGSVGEGGGGLGGGELDPDGARHAEADDVEAHGGAYFPTAGGPERSDEEQEHGGAVFGTAADDRDEPAGQGHAVLPELA